VHVPVHVLVSVSMIVLVHVHVPVSVLVHVHVYVFIVPVSCACSVVADAMGALGLGGPPSRVMPDSVRSRPSLACFSAASACLIASASRRAPVYCLALVARSFASAACRCRIALRGSGGLGRVLPVAATLPLSWVGVMLSNWRVDCREVEEGSVCGFIGSSFWSFGCFSKSVRMSWCLFRVQVHAILSSRLPVRPFAGLNLSWGGGGGGGQGQKCRGL